VILIERVFYVYHTVYDAFWSPDVPQGAMVRREGAATFESAENAALVAAELNERSNRSTLDAMVDPWIVVDG
jgi:hypothetical protein